MKIPSLLAWLLAGSTALQAGELEINSLTSNGRLTFTNAFSNGLYTVQWAPSLPAVWRDSWINLNDFAVTGTTTTVEVPMFYGVKCVTNPFCTMPLGRTLIYATSNTVETWTMTVSFGGRLALLGQTSEYSVMLLRDGGFNLDDAFLRSTESALYRRTLDPFDECVIWTNAPVGSSWVSNVEGDRTTRSVTARGVVVVVPAGTFTDCIEFEERDSSSGMLIDREWVKPGFYMVKEIDYEGNGIKPIPWVRELVKVE